VREALDRKEIEVKAAEIAQELGWQVTEQLDYGVTISDGDQRIVIRDSGHRDNHLLITAPDDVRPEGYGSLISGITVGEAQDSAAIAREIERRFFPLYADYMNRVRAYIVWQDQLRVIREGVAGRLLAALPGSRERWPGLIEYRQLPVTASADIASDGSSVDLSLNVSPAIAENIFLLLAEDE